MRIYAQRTIPERDVLISRRNYEYAEHIRRSVKNSLSLSIAKFIEPYIQVETLKEGEVAEIKRVELIVISKKQFEEIGNLTVYDPYQDNQFEAERRFNQIISILMRDNLE